MKKLLTILLSLLLLVSCSSTIQTETDEQALKYIEILENYEVKDKNPNNTVDDESFNDFLEEACRYYMSLDFLSMHYEVKDYKALGIEKPEVTIGSLEYGFDQEGYDKECEYLERLHEFDYDSLSYSQQFDYDAYEYSLYEDLTSYYFYGYGSLLSDGNCVPEDIFSNLTDYTFYDVESIDDYITLLKDVPRYFNEIYEYTLAQQNDYHYQLDEWIEYTKSAIEGILNNTENNDLITTFDSRIDELDYLTEEEKTSYKQTNKDLVLNTVLPAYEELNSHLDEFTGFVKISDYSLVKQNKDYARYLFILNTSCNDSMEEMKENLLNAIYYYENQLTYLSTNEDIYNETFEIFENPKGALSLTGEECLDYLRDNMGDYFPVVNAQYSVKVLSSDTASDSTIGYYYNSPIDDKEQNIICLNPNNLSSGIGTYVVLAHEGFPGHLYQNYYYSLTNPNMIRRIISFIGYSEGYALYASNIAMYYSGIKNNITADILFYNEESYFYLYSLIDILTNYDGYSLKQVEKYFESNLNYSYYDDDAIEVLYDYVIENPTVYSRYAIGAAKLLSYREDILKGIDMKTYHELILENGPLPFAILDDVVDDFASSNVVY